MGLAIYKQNLTPSLNIFALLPSMSASKENTRIQPSYIATG